MKNKFLIILISICFSDYSIVQIDASSYTEWVYFSFASGEIVETDDPMNSNDWDLGVMRNHFRTNSGLSGNGYGGAYIDSSFIWTSENWESIIEVPNNAIFNVDGILDNIYDIQNHVFLEAPGNLVLEKWGFIDIDNNYEFNYNNYLFIIRTAIGEYVKFWPYSYYNEQDESGYISIAYETNIPENDCNNSGDVNFDGMINISDIVIIVEHILLINILNGDAYCQADINYDLLLDVFDIVGIINNILS